MTPVDYLFQGWEPFVRLVIVGVTMYVSLVLFFRLSGSRTLANMDSFDFIVTVAIGSTFGRALTARGVALGEAVVAFALLIALQYAVAWLQTRWRGVRRIVTNSPSLLYFRGEFMRDEMRSQRVTENELLEAVRRTGLGSIDQAEAIVLEASGDVSVVTSPGDGSALSGLVRDGARG